MHYLQHVQYQNGTISILDEKNRHIPLICTNNKGSTTIHTIASLNKACFMTLYTETETLRKTQGVEEIPSPIVHPLCMQHLTPFYLNYMVLMRCLKLNTIYVYTSHLYRCSCSFGNGHHMHRYFQLNFLFIYRVERKRKF